MQASYELDHRIGERQEDALVPLMRMPGDKGPVGEMETMIETTLWFVCNEENAKKIIEVLDDHGWMPW